ncbi:MAG: hypothetical protein M1821_005696 [Bathelium mastoideum]|nr:MAG: hypothetical protein M1821_005696 [Bathelium mastoideum]
MIETSSTETRSMMVDEKDEASALSAQTLLAHGDRYSRHRKQKDIKNLFTIVLIALLLLALFTIYTTGYLASESVLFSDRDENDLHISYHSSSFQPRLPHAEWPRSNGLGYDKLKNILLETPVPQKAREWSRYYTAGQQLAGKNISQAEWTRDKWIEFGVPQSELVAYDEDVLAEDPTSSLLGVPTFHGYSANGNVTAQFVYYGFGTYADFEDLRDAGIKLEGKIALMKYGGGAFRGLKVKCASELGMIGAVIYSDPSEDGEITEENGFQPYPHGPARNPSSVQRGSVQYMSIAPGDPTTIGYPSKGGCGRQLVDGKIPDIPSLPISYRDALPLLRALNGHGPEATSFERAAWHSGSLRYKGVNYNIGPSPTAIELNLYNEVEYVTSPIWNVIGIINGSISDEVILIGNHRDAWTGGAADPNSGSAALNEVIRSFGIAMAKGWKPLRTIVFASWDGEEYGLLGSTEWVEEFLPWLQESAIAYLNVDIGARSENFTAAASPVLHQALHEITASVPSPNQTIHGQTVFDVWNGIIRPIGSGSDFTAFQDFAGISSLDMGFSAFSDRAVYHYHSIYDSFHWMNQFGDVNWEYHTTLAKIWALLTAKLVEEPIITFSATDYAKNLERYLDSIRGAAKATRIHSEVVATNYEKLEHAIHELQRSSIGFDAYVARLARLVKSKISRPPRDRRKLYLQVQAVNKKYKRLEKTFLHEPGLDSRGWFKHVVFAPGLWTGYASSAYPGLVEALEFGTEDDVARWTRIIVGRIHEATDLLKR